jgi:hypothetical protein
MSIPMFRAFLVGGISVVVCASKLEVAVALVVDLVRFLPACYNLR